jgi:hypothetical protein
MTLSSYQSGFLRLEACRRRKRLESRLVQKDELNQVYVERELFCNSAVTGEYSTAFDLRYDTCWECQALPSRIGILGSISVLGGPEGGSYYCNHVCSVYGKCNLGSSAIIPYQPYIFFPIGAVRGVEELGIRRTLRCNIALW